MGMDDGLSDLTDLADLSDLISELASDLTRQYNQVTRFFGIVRIADLFHSHHSL